MSGDAGPDVGRASAEKSIWDRIRVHGPSQLQFWIIALVLGVLAGYATVAFRLSISWLQELFYGADDVTLASHAAGLAWYWIVGIPIVGGQPETGEKNE